MKIGALLLAVIVIAASTAHAQAPAAKVFNTVFQCDEGKIVVVEQAVTRMAGQPIKLTIGYDEHEMKMASATTGTRYLNDDGDIEWVTAGETSELTDPKTRKKLAGNCKVIK